MISCMIYTTMIPIFSPLLPWTPCNSQAATTATTTAAMRTATTTATSARAMTTTRTKAAAASTAMEPKAMK
ncbi:hypothetical protein BC941DRAFT_436777 [Chlamydoabsidia padenii]|nr:hypothetical protein BC941DRAFT_436777 [Chlamydoabsidia padenii]